MSTMQRRDDAGCCISLAAVSTAAGRLIPAFVYKQTQELRDSAGSEVFDRSQ